MRASSAKVAFPPTHLEGASCGGGCSVLFVPELKAVSLAAGRAFFSPRWSASRDSPMAGGRCFSGFQSFCTCVAPSWFLGCRALWRRVFLRERALALERLTSNSSTANDDNGARRARSLSGC